MTVSVVFDNGFQRDFTWYEDLRDWLINTRENIGLPIHVVSVSGDFPPGQRPNYHKPKVT